MKLKCQHGAVAAALAWTSLDHCAAPPPREPPPDPAGTPERSEGSVATSMVDWGCWAWRRGERLYVHYSVHNRSEQDLAVLNRIRAWYLSPDLLYPLLDGETLRLSKSYLPTEPPPLSMRLAPGESIEETFTVRIPVTAFTPGLWPPPYRFDRLVWSDHVTVEIGLLPLDEECRTQPLPGAPPNTHELRCDKLAERQLLLTSSFVLDEPIQVWEDTRRASTTPR